MDGQPQAQPGWSPEALALHVVRRVVGVDEHVWRHTRHGDKCVTVIIDLTPIRDGTGASRLLDMVEGRSKQAFKQWLAGRLQRWRDGVEATWGIYQRMIASYRHPDRTRGKHLMQALIDALSSGFPTALTELITLGRTLKRRAADVLA